MSATSPVGSVAWLDGTLAPLSTHSLSPAERGYLLADGLFETFAIRHGTPRRTSLHWQRLLAGCAVLSLPCPDEDTVLRAMAEVLAANALEHGSLRLTWSRGQGPRGLLPPPEADCRPTLLLTVAPASPAALPAARLVTATCTRRNEHSPLSRIKSLNYGDGLLARLEAQRLGADDALLLNTAGRLAETSVASLFLCLQGRWWTPAVHDGALPGVCRAELLASGLVQEASLSPQEAARAEAMVSGNALGLRAMASLDGRPLSVAQAEDWIGASGF